MRSKIVLLLAPVATLFNGAELFAQSYGSTNGPPAPNPGRTPGPPVDASLPIDDNIMVLLIAGLILGIYYVYSLHRTKKKAA